MLSFGLVNSLHKRQHSIRQALVRPETTADDIELTYVGQGQQGL